jgi:hypothetical protein
MKIIKGITPADLRGCPDTTLFFHNKEDSKDRN